MKNNTNSLQIKKSTNSKFKDRIALNRAVGLLSGINNILKSSQDINKAGIKIVVSEAIRLIDGVLGE